MNGSVDVLTRQVIGGLLTIILALLGWQTRQLLKTIRDIAAQQKKSDLYAQNLAEATFRLFDKLNPNSSVVIGIAMREFYRDPYRKLKADD